MLKRKKLNWLSIRTICGGETITHTEVWLEQIALKFLNTCRAGGNIYPGQGKTYIYIQKMKIW